MDPYEFLSISRNPDGSLTRYARIPLSSPTGERTPDSSTPVLSKDVPLNITQNTWLRIFLPKLPSTSAEKLPVVIYFHAGGFILCSTATKLIHDFTARMAADLPAVVVSVEYRLAPEHRLPGAYEDAVDALLWVRDQARSLDPASMEPWLRAHADFSWCFLMGSSSGGNIAYHLGLRTMGLDLEPLKVAGLILDQPFFGGEERTESEVRMAEDRKVPLVVTDLMWELSLPRGADRDHEYSKPIPLNGKGKGLPRCMVRGYLGDPLIDRQRMVATMLEREGVSVVARLEEDGDHGIELNEPNKAEAMMADLRSFLYDKWYF